MSTSTSPSDLPTHAFPTASAFDNFLSSEHASAPGIYLKFSKKASGIPSITGAEAVEIALCYGWIDGRANGVDDKWWTVRFTPRRNKSMWSQKNVGTVARLIEEGRMKPAGLAAIEAAKKDGRWDRAYAGPATMVPPEDFLEKLKTEPTADATWEVMNKSEKYSVVMQLVNIADKNRERKIEALVQSLAVGNRTSAGTKKKKAAVKKTSEASAKVVKPLKARGVETKASSKPNGSERPRRAGLRSGT